MKNIYITIISLLIALSSGSINAQGNIRERLYLQTDKDIYISGELVWMKVLTTTSDFLPLIFSKVAYVELMDDLNPLVQIKINITQGAGAASMIIPVDLPSGTYRLIAYTNYMQNEDPLMVFEKILTIINPINPYSNRIKIIDEINKDNVEVSQTFSDNVTIRTDKANYNTREEVNVIIENIPRNIYSLSVSVAGDFSYYSLYNSTMTSWKDQMKNIPLPKFSSNFTAENIGTIINGRLLHKTTGQPVYDSLIIPYVAIVGEKINLYSGILNNEGYVSFSAARLEDTHEIVATYLSANKKDYIIEIESPFRRILEKKELPEVCIDKNILGQIMRQSVSTQVLYSYMADSLNRFTRRDDYFTQRPDQSYLVDNYTRFKTVGEVIKEYVLDTRFKKKKGKRIIQVRRVYELYPEGAALVLLDGIPVFDHEIIYNYNSSFVKRIDTYSNIYYIGAQKFEGLVVITTHTNNAPNFVPDETMTFFTYQGTEPQRIFFIPDYADPTTKESPLADYRHTLYWNPSAEREISGISFYTSDLTGKYKITVEGLTEDGKTIYSNYHFTVN